MTFPYTRWEPLSVAEVAALFRDAPFPWGLAGGYAVEQFLGTSIRAHDDIDIVVFRDDQAQLYQWLYAWHLFAADPPGTLRPWNRGEYLAPGIHDIWAYEHAAHAWQLQIMLIETDGDAWVSREQHVLLGEVAYADGEDAEVGHARLLRMDAFHPDPGDPFALVLSC